MSIFIVFNLKVITKFSLYANILLSIEGGRKINIVHSAIMFVLKRHISPNTTDILLNNLSIIWTSDLLMPDFICEKH